MHIVLPFLSSARLLPITSLLPNSNPLRLPPLRHPFDMEHPSYAAPNHRSEITLALHEASTLKAEWADIRISGQFNP